MNKQLIVELSSIGVSVMLGVSLARLDWLGIAAWFTAVIFCYLYKTELWSF